MTQVLLALGVLLLLLPGWCEPRAQQVEARQRARAYRTSLSTGLVATLSGSLLWAAPIALHLADRWGLPGLCDGVIHDLPLGGLELALGALTLGLVLMARLVGAFVRAMARSRDARIDPFVGDHRLVSEFDVVVVASDRLLAVGVPGSQPQIVLTDGLVAALEPAELDAVLRHEIAHHRLRHRNYLVLATVLNHAFGWVPGVRRSTEALADALEEWADLASTRRVPERVERLHSALNRLGGLHVTTGARRALRRRVENLEFSSASVNPSPRGVGLVVGLGSSIGVAMLAVAFGAQAMLVFGRCAT